MFAANYAVALRDAGKLSEALEMYDRAIALDPQNGSAYFDRAQIRLILGDYAGGWSDYEWRWRLPGMQMPRFKQPLWDGRVLPGRRLLLWPEQGFGDAVLSIRFAKYIRERVDKIILACKPELVHLLDGVEGVDQLVPFSGELPEFDVHCPLMTLPGFCVRDPARVPPPVRLTIPSEARAKAARLLAPAGKRLKVGIVWSGSVTFKSNHLRSTSFERFLRLAELPDIQLFSLQKGPPAADLAARGTGVLVIDLGPSLNDFADTAAVIESLDLVIMTDSAVAHLAGSLGKAVWNLVPFVAYWQYPHGRCDTPWYPSMRIFRQPQPGDWDSVFEDVVRSLEHLVSTRRLSMQNAAIPKTFIGESKLTRMPAPIAVDQSATGLGPSIITVSRPC